MNKKRLYPVVLILTLMPVTFFGKPHIFNADRPQLNWVELTFDNGQYYRVVKKGEQAPQIRCRLMAQGTGVIQGIWKINNQTVHSFQLALSGFQNLSITGSQLPFIPSNDSGFYLVSLHWQNLPDSLQMPILRYFVSLEPPIKSLLPELNSHIALHQDVTLSWTPVKGEYQYQVAISQIPFQFLGDSQIIWQEPVNSPTWRVASPKLVAGYVYWMVRAVSSTGRIISASEINSFLLKDIPK